VKLGRAAAVVCALAVAVSAFGSHAAAHLKFPELPGERAIEIDLQQRPIRIGYRLSFGPELAERERGRADRDANGELSALEGNARLDERTRGLIEKLRVCVGPTLENLACHPVFARQVERVEAQGWDPNAARDLHLSFSLKLDESIEDIGALRFEDATTDNQFAITDVRIVAPEAQPLIVAADGQSPSGVATDFNWNEARRPLGPRVVVIAWRPPPLFRTKQLLAAAGALLILIFAYGRWRRRKP
jgi:hypothetical protein